MSRTLTRLANIEAAWATLPDPRMDDSAYTALHRLYLSLLAAAGRGEPFDWPCRCCRGWIDQQYEWAVNAVALMRADPKADVPDASPHVPDHVIILARERSAA